MIYNLVTKLILHIIINTTMLLLLLLFEVLQNITKSNQEWKLDFDNIKNQNTHKNISK